MNVILQPCADRAARRNYAKTVENAVNFVGVPAFGLIEGALNGLFPNGALRVWGVTPGVRGQRIEPFKRVSPGDVALFYRDNEVFSVGKVSLTTRSREMADYLWGPKSQELSFELIYFLDKIVPVTIHRAELNRAISYSENYIIQSFVVLSATQSESVLNAFPVLSSLSGITAQEYRVALDGLQSADSLDRKVDAFSRVEQTYLRQLLFPTPTARCAICGNELPIDLLVAGHIKKRSACSLEEKKDAQNIVMPICGLGCDELFERGYISVDADGAVVSSKSAETATLASLLSSLRGRRCSNFRPENEQYFQWHFNTVYRG